MADALLFGRIGGPDINEYVSDPVGSQFFVLADHLEPDLDPRAIAKRLVETCEEFEELKQGEPAIFFVMRTYEKARQHRRIIGTMSLPTFQGAQAAFCEWLLCKACGAMPDLIMTLEASWWMDSSPIQREMLVHHELKHAIYKRNKDGEIVFDDAGKPKWDILGHDIEEFRDTVQRYGKHMPDVIAFVASARMGGVGSNG